MLDRLIWGRFLVPAAIMRDGGRSVIGQKQPNGIKANVSLKRSFAEGL